MSSRNHDAQSRSDRSSDLVPGYTEFLRYLFAAGYTRVERDDRLLDIFPGEDREKGIELWERWAEDEVKILRLRIPYETKKLQLFVVEKRELEELLLNNRPQQLDDNTVQAHGEAVIPQL